MKCKIIFKDAFLSLFKHPVTRNALALYVVQFINYLFPLVTIPYLTRVLRPEGWGLVVFAQSFALWLSLVLEYGFNLSATREISRNNQDLNHISQVVDGVMGAKGLLVAGSLIVGLLAGWATPIFRQYSVYLWLAWLSAVAQGLSPLWYFQGLERMHLPAILNVVARFLSVVLIFLLVNNSGDGWVVLALQVGAGVFSSGVALILMYREVPFHWPGLDQAVLALRTGWSMFFFRSAVSFYTTANAFILGFFVPPAQVGFYGGAEKISKAVLAMLNPISQALYPRINNLVAKNYTGAVGLARFSFLLMGGLGICLGGMVAATAPLIVKILLGTDFDPSVPVLQLFSLLIPLIALSNVMGIQWMLPLKLDRLFNIIILTAGGINLCLAFLLAPRFGPMGMAAAVVLSESFVTFGMFVALWRRNLSPLGGLKHES